ncbi:Hypothetical predicted protein, partial [Olea europaea subsp. europaea]
QFMGTVCKPCPRGVLAMDATDFQAFVGQIWDKSWPRKGRCLIFRHFSTVFGHRVQAMSGTHPGRDRDVTSFSGISRSWCVGHVQDASEPR